MHAITHSLAVSLSLYSVFRFLMHAITHSLACAALVIILPAQLLQISMHAITHSLAVSLSLSLDSVSLILNARNHGLPL